MIRGGERRPVPGAGRGLMTALGALLFGGLLTLSIGTPTAATEPAGPAGSAADRLSDTHAADAARLGLDRSRDDGPCRGYGFEVSLPSGATGCSHGPDPAPEGIDLAAPRTLDELRADLATTDARMPALLEERVGADAPQVLAQTAASSTVPCVGYGTSGPRVQAIYAHVSGTPSRHAEVAPMIRAWAGQVNEVVDASAAQTGGSRNLRWLHDAACNVTVSQVALSVQAKTDLNKFMAELSGKGFNRADRRYLVWFDAEDAGICGVAVTIPDDRPGQDNPNNVSMPGLVHFGRVDTPCWGVPAPKNLVEAHELMHTLGAVQFSAPNTSGLSPSPGDPYWGHCVDEHDTMCYAASTPKPMVYRCPQSNERFLDCRHDDYFHTNPPAGSYLATRWNTAMSRFLVRVDPVAGFLDVSSSPFRGDIAWIGAERITTGCSADGERYCEHTVVTREQMASFLARALNLPPATRDFFTDDGASIHEGDINRVAQAGIASGCGGGRFCPTQVVVREQMASFLARAARAPLATRDFFTDDGASIHQGDINRVAQAGIASGCGGGRFCPTDPVTRGQMAAFLRRAFS